jgi:hypothetical protein
MTNYTPTQEATAILTRILESLARVNGKTLSRKTRADLARACELLSTGDNYDELLDDLLSTPPIRSERITQQFEREPAYGDPNFEAWRRQRYDDAR